MRLILLVYSFNNESTSQCFLYRDGKYTSVEYRSDGRMSKYTFGSTRGYDALLKDVNSVLLGLL